LSGTILKGQHDSLLGTELLFTDGKGTIHVLSKHQTILINLIIIQDSHDWNKRSVDHVANTEQRIGFKEVRLQPKKVPALQQDASIAPPKKAKEKGKAKEVTATETGGAAQEDDIQMLDRMTGKSGPLPRASRTRGEGSKSKKATKGKGRKKGSKDVEVSGGDVISGDGQAGPGPGDAMDTTEG
jgi:hypothetical protein